MRQTPGTTEMIQAILGTIDEGIHAVDAEGFTIYYNRVAAKLDGLEKTEVEGKHLLKVFPSLTSETSTLLKVIETGEPIYHQPQEYTNLKGHRVETVNSTMPIMVDGELAGALEVAKDLSQVRELSERLLDLQAKVNKPKQVETDHNESGAVFRFTDVITESEKLNRVKEQAMKGAQTSSPILIYGETGTGKELLVQSIHNASPRSDASFIAQNCAALPASLLESILFGTVKGSFTGAVDRQGLFELANGGTLFLDEINSMPLELQAKLLRVLQDGHVRRVGGTNVFPVDVRLIAATNEDPLKAVEENQLRSDLYYRINVVSFQIPPLRERKEDIPLLVDSFVKKYNYRFNRLVTGLDDEVDWIFADYDWPGNVRELEHVIEAAMNMVEEDTIRSEHLPPHFMDRVRSRRGKGVSVNETVVGQEVRPLREAVEAVESDLIVRALQETEGNVQKASKQLGVPRQTLQYKMKKYEID